MLFGLPHQCLAAIPNQSHQKYTNIDIIECKRRITTFTKSPDATRSVKFGWSLPRLQTIRLQLALQQWHTQMDFDSLSLSLSTRYANLVSYVLNATAANEYRYGDCVGKKKVWLWFVFKILNFDNFFAYRRVPVVAFDRARRCGPVCQFLKGGKKMCVNTEKHKPTTSAIDTSINWSGSATRAIKRARHQRSQSSMRAK